MLSEDPQQPMEAATKEYVDTKGGVLSWNGRAGAVTMTSTDVMTAQGYSSYDAANPAGYQTATQVSDAINFAVPQPSNTNPAMDGTAAPGQINQWARGDHVHPTDTTRYAASNPSNFQTATQVTASLGGYLPLAGGTLTGNVILPALVATTGLASTSGGAAPILITDPPAADNSAALPSTRWVRNLIGAGGIPDAPNDGTMYARISAAWARVSSLFLALSGGTLTGPVIAAADPVDPLGLATKQYVDGQNVRYRNRLINGDMSVDQRNNGASVSVVGSSYLVDRWAIYTNISTAKGAAGGTPETPAPGFPYSASLFWNTNVAAYAPTAADYYFFCQFIEGVNFADAMFGTANAQPLVLEFWVRASQTGVFAGAMRNNGNTRSYVFTFNITAVNTFQKFRINIPGDTAGTWSVASTAIAASVSFSLGVGTNFQTSTPNTWLAASSLSTPGAINTVATLNATMRFTGVALMVGAGAANAEPAFKSYADNLIDCQRYYNVARPLTIINASVGTSYTTGVSIPTMRIAPLVSVLTNLSGGLTAAPSPVTGGTNYSVYLSGSPAASGPITIGAVVAANAEL
jgi:hypothetical protein